MFHRILTLATLSMLMALVTPASGQSYSPHTPTTSPYLNLLRFNSGPLPNYQSLVRPQLYQRQFNQNMQRQVRQNAIRSNQPQMTNGAAPLGIRELRMQPTGVHGQFQYYSHYFGSDRSSAGGGDSQSRFRRRSIPISGGPPRTVPRTGQTYTDSIRSRGFSY